MAKKWMVSLVTCLIALSIVSVFPGMTAPQDELLNSPDVDLKITGGVGLTLEYYNNGPDAAIVWFNVSYYSSSGRYLNTWSSGEQGNPLPAEIGWKIHSLPVLTLHPLQRVEARVWTKSKSLTRTGIVLCSSFFFLTGPRQA